MFESEVAKEFARAKASGRRYLLVCFDSWDRLKGDGDLGYYYPTFGTAEEARRFLAGKQVGEWDPGNSADCCEAVIDLEAAGEEFSRECCQPPGWLVGS